MTQSTPAKSGCLLGPLEYHPLVPIGPTVLSRGLGWTGLEATRFSDWGDADFERPALTHHSLCNGRIGDIASDGDQASEPSGLMDRELATTR